MKDKLLSQLTIEDVGTIQAPAGVPSGPDFSLGNLATTGIAVMMIFGIILALLYLIWGGFSWITSGGDKEKLDKARKIIIYSILGLILMSLALVVVNVLASALGLNTDSLFQ